MFKKVGSFLLLVGKYVWKEILIKYLLCYLLAITFFVFLPKINDASVKSIIINIISSLVSLPLVFIVYDLYKRGLELKSSRAINRVISKKINDIFLKFIYFTTSFYEDMHSKSEYDINNIDNELKQDEESIFKRISENKHYGYFIFSIFDNFDDDVENVLDSNIVARYIDNKEIAILYDFIYKYKVLKESFYLVSPEDFIRFQRIPNIDFVESRFAKSLDSKEKIYDIHIKEGTHDVVCYSASYRLFDQEALSYNYKLSGNKAKEISIIIFQLYRYINKWKKLKHIKNLTYESALISSNRLCIDAEVIINFHMQENNISIKGDFN